MDIRFNSITRPQEIGYIFTTASEYNAPARRLHSQMKQYETYGDGTTQPRPAYHVQPKQFNDYLTSFTAYLLDNGTPEMFDSIAMYITKPASFDYTFNKIKFFQSLKDNPDKFTYYNPDDLKTSTSEKKQHDRRWYRMPEFADGSMRGTYKLYKMHAGYIDGFLEEMTILFNIRRAFDLIFNTYTSIDAEEPAYQIPPESLSISDMQAAHDIFFDLIDAHAKIARSRKRLDIYKGNLENQRQREAAEKGA